MNEGQESRQADCLPLGVAWQCVSDASQVGVSHSSLKGVDGAVLRVDEQSDVNEVEVDVDGVSQA